MDENYTNVHRAFLQACSRFSVLGPNQALTILESVQKKRKLQPGIFAFFVLPKVG